MAEVALTHRSFWPADNLSDGTSPAQIQTAHSAIVVRIRKNIDTKVENRSGKTAIRPAFTYKSVDKLWIKNFRKQFIHIFPDRQAHSPACFAASTDDIFYSKLE